MSTDLDKSLADLLLERAGGKITPELINSLRVADPEVAAELESRIKDKAASHPTVKILKQFITQSPSMIKLKQQVEKLAGVDDPILIQGESGTGKELLAKALHGLREGAFVAINCSGIPESLIESELFGHDKGSFTGAFKEKEGLFVSAKNGTLFLDEIGDMPLLMQSKLLRVLQEKVVKRVGSNIDIKINCRVVAATHKDLRKMVFMGTFRNDLYYRLSTFILKPSPLRERVNDIPLIIEGMDHSEQIEDIVSFCAMIDKTQLEGNVRSLQQLVRRYVVLGIKPKEDL